MHFPSTRSVRGALLTAALSTGLAAQGQFLNLPSGAGTAFSVSDDGSVVGGYGKTGVFRWTNAGGTQYLNLLASSYVKVSSDGSVVMSTMRGSSTASGLDEAAYWTQANNWTTIGSLYGNNCSGSMTSGYDLSDDGTVIVGLGWQGCLGRAFRWDTTNGILQLPVEQPSSLASTRANAVSGDGMVIGGWDEAQNGQRRAAVWFPAGIGYNEVIIIPPSAANPVSAGEVWDFNHDGTVIVGEQTAAPAWRWTASTGFQSLGGFPGSVGGDTGSAYGTNEDGSMIVGVSGSYFTGWGTFMWTEEDGMQRLEDFLADQSIAIPSGPELTWVFDISPSGYHIVGRRGDFRNVPVGEVAFWVELPAGVRYGMHHGGTNIMRLSGTGSSALGGTVAVATAQVPGTSQSVSTVVGLASTKVPVFGGTLLVDLGQPHVALTLPASSGTSGFNLSIPNVPQIVGESLYLQSIVIDPNVTGGLGFSNGIEITITQ